MTFIDLVKVLIQVAPYIGQAVGAVEALIAAVQGMRGLTPEQQAAAVTVLRGALADEVARVQAVKLP